MPQIHIQLSSAYEFWIPQSQSIFHTCIRIDIRHEIDRNNRVYFRCFRINVLSGYHQPALPRTQWRFHIPLMNCTQLLLSHSNAYASKHYKMSNRAKKNISLLIYHSFLDLISDLLRKFMRKITRLHLLLT